MYVCVYVICVYVCVHSCVWHTCVGALRIAPNVHPHLPPCLRQSGLLLATAYTRLAAQSFQGFSCLHLPSPSGNVGIIHAHCLSHYSIAVKRYQGQGSSYRRKPWGLAYRFQRLSPLSSRWKYGSRYGKHGAGKVFKSYLITGRQRGGGQEIEPSSAFELSRPTPVIHFFQ